jgi:hypothetical protein
VRKASVIAVRALAVTKPCASRASRLKASSAAWATKALIAFIFALA